MATVSSSNFSTNSLVGTSVVKNGFANISLSITPYVLEGDKQYTIKLRKDSASGSILVTVPTQTIRDNSSFVSLTANTASINEGDLVSYTLVLANAVNNANLFYSIVPFSANLTQSDFFANTGVITIVNNQATFTVRANVDAGFIDETGEAFRLQLRQGSPTGNIFFTTTANVTIVDTYKLINYVSLIESASSAAELDTVTFTFTAYNVTPGTVFYYDTVGNVTSSTFSTGNTGSFVMNSSSNVISLTDVGIPANETRFYQLNIRSGNANGTIVMTSNVITLLDSSLAYINASGGTIIDSGGYRTHTFSTSGNLTISSLGAGSKNLADYLAVAGGGAGYNNVNNGFGGSGGGAGGLINSSFVAAATGNIIVVIGAGGVGQNDVRNNGGNTTILNGGTTITAVGGGSGGWNNESGLPGGSGGGAGQSPTTRTAASGYGYPSPTQQGYPGSTSGPGLFHGGGGGAGQAGQESIGEYAGNGGNGLTIPWSPSLYGTTGPAPGRWFAGGGGAGGLTPYGNYYGGSGGAGGGGAGQGQAGPTGFAGNVNTGGGGGGSKSSGAPSFSGGSGIVLIRYPYVPPPTVTNVITTSSAFIVGSNITFTVNTLNANTITLYYTTDGNVTLSNFIGGNTGSFVANASGGRVTLRANTNIPLDESRSFRLQIRQDSTTGFISGSSANVTIDGFASQISATGGTITTAGGYRTHTFLASNNFVLSKLSTDNIEYLIVAGGGSGGTLYGGGGGAGGMLYGNLTYQQISPGTYSMVVGAGGTSVLNGSNSSGLGILSIGGGAGGVYSFSPSPVDQENSVAKAGGSGGGAASGRAGYGPAPDGGWYGGLGIAGQGFAGGTRLQPLVVNYGAYESAGGGGAGGFGANVSVRQEKGGNGGIGVQWVNGTYYAGGGGGWGYQSPTADAPSYSNTPYTQSLGLGGLGGGGNGSKYYTSSSPLIKFNSTSGTVNTGGGGGGHDTSGNPSPSEPGNPANSAGGSGIVIIRYPYV